MSVPMFLRDIPANGAIQGPIGYGAGPPRLAVAREMIASLDTLTAAGQRHMMSKILALFQATVGRHPPGNGSRNQRALSDLVDRLAQEADHLWPDPHQFRQHADSLLRLLTAIT